MGEALQLPITFSDKNCENEFEFTDLNFLIILVHVCTLLKKMLVNSYY